MKTDDPEIARIMAMVPEKYRKDGTADIQQWIRDVGGEKLLKPEDWRNVCNVIHAAESHMATIERERDEWREKAETYSQQSADTIARLQQERDALSGPVTEVATAMLNRGMTSGDVTVIKTAELETLREHLSAAKSDAASGSMELECTIAAMTALAEERDAANAKLRRVRDFFKYVANSPGGLVAELDPDAERSE